MKPMKPYELSARERQIYDTFDGSVVAYGLNMPFRAWYSYSPEERATRDYPGAPAELEIVAVAIGGHTVDFLSLSDEEAEEIERQVKAHIDSV